MELLKVKEYLKENKNVEQWYYEGLKEKTIEQKYQYIKNHFQYDIMNSWNNLKSFANTVKVYNIGLTNEQQDKFFELMEIDPYYLSDYINYYIQDFQKLTETEIFFNGRSAGYIVIIPKCERNIHLLEFYHIDDILYFNTYKEFKEEQRQYSNYDQSYKYDIERVYYILKAFDKFCDILRSELIYLLENYKIEEHEETYTRTVKEIII